MKYFSEKHEKLLTKLVFDIIFAEIYFSTNIPILIIIMDLFNFAWFPDFFEKIKDLEALVMKEDWDSRLHLSDSGHGHQQFTINSQT